MRVVTIGVYGSTEDTFFAALQKAGVEKLIDIRQRRGVRGRKYAYVNSQRLQERLAQIGIGYLHMKQFAPTKEIRELQKQDDERRGISKRERLTLGEVFTVEYQKRCLNSYDPNNFIKDVGAETKVIALFCVEGHPKACHRMLVAEFLHKRLGLEVEHLRS